MFEERDRLMYAYMTYYDSHGYCWIQPMRTKNHPHDNEYNRYIVRVNKAAKLNELGYLDETIIKVGMDIVARYEVDRVWYRAMVVEKIADDAWLVLFVDFGNLQRCSAEEMKRPLHTKDCDHFHSALQAVCCRLYNIVPNNQSDQEKIDMSLADFYAKHTSKILKLYVRNIRPDYVIDCDLFLPKRGVVGEESIHRRHIGQFLVDSGLASFADPMNARAIKLPSQPKETVADLITIDEDDETKTEIKSNVKLDIKAEVKPNIKSEVEPDIKPDVQLLTAPRVVHYST